MLSKFRALRAATKNSLLECSSVETWKILKMIFVVTRTIFKTMFSDVVHMKFPTTNWNCLHISILLHENSRGWNVWAALAFREHIVAGR